MACIDRRGKDPDRRATVAAVLAAGVAVTGCTAEETAKTARANPAAVFCVDSGGTYDIRRAADGSESGVCILADGTEVDAWTYFRANAAME
jgi:putative hemolysin